MSETRTTLDTTMRELPLAAGGELELRLGSNRLHLRITDGDCVVIRGRTDHDLERDLEIQSGNGWVRVTDGPVGSLRFGPLTVRNGGQAPDLDVEVPRNVRISARTLSGDIEAVGIAGPSRWQSASGSIRIGADAGPLSIDTVSGDAYVDARAPLAVTCRTVSGSVKVSAPRISALDVATTSGDMTIGAALDEGVTHSLTSVSGDVRLSTDSEVTIDFQSVAGDIRVSMPHRIEARAAGAPRSWGRAGCGSPSGTLSGDLKLKPGSGDGAGQNAEAAAALPARPPPPERRRRRRPSGPISGATGPSPRRTGRSGARPGPREWRGAARRLPAPAPRGQPRRVRRSLRPRIPRGRPHNRRRPPPRRGTPLRSATSRSATFSRTLTRSRSRPARRWIPRASGRPMRRQRRTSTTRRRSPR